jgi:hypothetical protein
MPWDFDNLATKPTKMSILGWGETGELFRGSLLQTLQVPVCKDSSDGVFKTEHDEKRGARQGDSGGPLYSKEEGIATLRGIISCSIVSSRERSTYYIDVEYYRGWIEEVLNSLELESVFQ